MSPGPSSRPVPSRSMVCRSRYYQISGVSKLADDHDIVIIVAAGSLGDDDDHVNCKADRIGVVAGTGGRARGVGLAISSTLMAALPALTANLALELAPIRVNLIAPGFVDTPLSASLLGDQLEARRNELRARVPIRRVVGPADVAALAVHIMTNTALDVVVVDEPFGRRGDAPAARHRIGHERVGLAQRDLVLGQPGQEPVGSARRADLVPARQRARMLLQLAHA